MERWLIRRETIYPSQGMLKCYSQQILLQSADFYTSADFGIHREPWANAPRTPRDDYLYNITATWFYNMNHVSEASKLMKIVGDCFACFFQLRSPFIEYQRSQLFLTSHQVWTPDLKAAMLSRLPRNQPTFLGSWPPENTRAELLPSGGRGRSTCDQSSLAWDRRSPWSPHTDEGPCATTTTCYPSTSWCQRDRKVAHLSSPGPLSALVVSTEQLDWLSRYHRLVALPSPPTLMFSSVIALLLSC